MHIAIEGGQHRVVAFQITACPRGLLQHSRLDLAQKSHRAVACLFPQRRIEIAIQRARLGMPAPPQVIRQFIEPANARRHDWEDRHTAIDFHRYASFLDLFSFPVYLLLEKRSNQSFPNLSDLSSSPLRKDWEIKRGRLSFALH